MNKLQQLYKERDTFSKYGSEVPSALAAQIAEAEKEMLQMELLPIIEESALKTLPTYGIDGNVLIAIEYDNCALTRIAIASDADKITDFDVVKDISSVVEEPADEYVPESDDEDEKPGIRRSASIGFSVHFDDGKVIAEKSAHRTMIEALRYMGLERASHFNETFKGYPLVGTKQRITDNGYNGNDMLMGGGFTPTLPTNAKLSASRALVKCSTFLSKSFWKMKTTLSLSTSR